jgi:hypothetical protein
VTSIWPLAYSFLPVNGTPPVNDGWYSHVMGNVRGEGPSLVMGRQGVAPGSWLSVVTCVIYRGKVAMAVWSLLVEVGGCCPRSYVMPVFTLV